MKQTNIEKLITWMEGYKQLYSHSDDCIKMSETILAKAKQLQQESLSQESDGDKIYTQEEMNKAKSESWWEGWKSYGESL